ncbi:alpha/beta hydrolase [Kribbella sp. NBC_01505]|uniref:alpha/beta hydrolase n=1 Tax=Kribbella sp. NBC_01505 TaxID=2903580 RepID=UPI003864DDBA
MKRLGIAVGLAALMAGLLSPGPANGASAGLVWGACEGDVPVVYQCATATVPLDFRQPHGKKIELALIRQPASDVEHKIGSMFLAHPLGTFDLMVDAPPGAFAAFSRFDVIGYDGRGAARAKPAVDCKTPRSLWDPFTTKATAPGRVDVDKMVRAADRYGQDCLKRNADLLPYLTSAAMARDLDLLRAMVGDERLTYVGMSQGTIIGATYASMFPARVRAMVLDSPADPAKWRDQPLRAFREQMAETEDVIGRFLKACATAPACGFGAGGPKAALDRLIKNLDSRPLPSADPADSLPIDGDDVRAALNNATYSPAFWADLADALAKAERGDGSAIRHAARFGFGDGPGNDPVSVENNLWEASLAADSKFPSTIGPYLRSGREGARDFPYAGTNATSTGYGLLIPGRWPVKGKDAYRGPFHNPSWAAPILVIGGTHDAATPYKWAKTLTKDLGNARLMTYESDGHGALNDGNLCLLIPALSYLTDGRTLPPQGTVCQQDFDPFPETG